MAAEGHRALTATWGGRSWLALASMKNPRIADYWTEPRLCCDEAWEAAYSRFETRAEETQKFERRLQGFGVEAWPRSLEVVEIFCGRGSGIEAWQRLGFAQVEGVDISENLLLQYEGAARLYVGDCRNLGLADASRDVICVQGGLHHLPVLPDDLEATVAEVWRVLRPGGRFLVVEPWVTPFLTAVHAACRSCALRRVSVRLDALAGMIEREREEYFNWLARPEEILARLTGRFETEHRRIALGKFSWIGRKPAGQSGRRT